MNLSLPKSSRYFTNIYLIYLFIVRVGVSIHGTTWVWRLEDNIWKSVLSFYHVVWRIELRSLALTASAFIC